MIFLKDVVKIPFQRNYYIKYAKRYGITFDSVKVNGVKNVLITKEKAEAVYKIYYKCDCPKYNETRLIIDNVKEYFTNK